MAFVLRRPLAVSSAFKQLARPSAAPFCAFHQSPSHLSPLKKPTAPLTAFSILQKSRNVFQSTFRRNYQQQTPGYGAGFGGGDMKQRLLYGAGIFGATVIGINLCVEAISYI